MRDWNEENGRIFATVNNVSGGCIRGTHLNEAKFSFDIPAWWNRESSGRYSTEDLRNSTIDEIAYSLIDCTDYNGEVKRYNAKREK